MSREFYMDDNFNRDYRERGIGNWTVMNACCNNADSISTLSNSYITVADGVSSHTENKLDELENSIKILNKQMENIKFSSKDIGAALKKINDKLSNGYCNLRSELKTLRGNGRYV